MPVPAGLLRAGLSRTGYPSGMTPRQAALLILSQFFPALPGELRRTTIEQYRTGGDQEAEITSALLHDRPLPGLEGREAGQAVQARLASGALRQAAEEAARRAELVGARLLFLGDDDYPAELAKTQEAPPVLYVRGNARVLTGAAELISMVGTRRPTPLGVAFAARLARETVERGGIIVSGLALGIDAAVHEAALAADGVTVAVLASGVDSLTPRSNAPLGRRMLEQGAIISEMPPGTEARPRIFPFRNRIIAGIASRVAVFEAGRSSGSTITGEYGVRYGRKVFALPGRPGDPATAGGLDLLADGAKPLTGTAALLAGGSAALADDPFAGLDVDLRQLVNTLSSELPCTVDELPLRLGLTEPQQVSRLLGGINVLTVMGLVQEDLFGRLQFTALPPEPAVR